MIKASIKEIYNLFIGTSILYMFLFNELCMT